MYKNAEGSPPPAPILSPGIATSRVPAAESAKHTPSGGTFQSILIGQRSHMGGADQSEPA